jgi:predicted enzyme related to lactoylglutathione lyase
MTDVRTEDAPMTAQSTQTGPNPAGDFIWYELMTSDADGAKAFYDAVVGWTIDPQSNFPNGYRMIGRSDGKFAGGLLPLNEEMRQHGARPTWLGYINVADVDEAAGSIERAGGKTQMPPTDIPNVGRIAMVTDPQGAPFYLMKPIPPADDPNARSDVFSPDSDQRVGWNELQTSDVEKARRFYGEQFGWESGDFMDMGEMGQYRFFDHHGVRLGALFNSNDGQPSRFRFYIRVPSISAAKQVAEQKGGTIHMGPHQVPTGDWILIGSDPQGAEFALVGGQ